MAESTESTDAKRCPNCGHEVSREANFCQRCGTRLGSDETTITLVGLEAADDDAAKRLLGDLPELGPDQALLVVVKGPNEGSRFVLAQPVVSVGRHPDSDIQLDDVTVSRRHAEFVRIEPGRYRVKDVGSLNGTYVNRERVDEAVLGNGDEVQIGRYRLRYVSAPRP